MKMNPVQAAVVAALASLAAGGAQAQATAWNPSWNFSGFGTLAYTKTSTDQGEFVNAGQWGGVDKDGGIGTDSLLGAQLNAQANSIFSVTLQALSEREGKGNYRPALEWGFLKAQVTPEISVRGGRIGTPFFMVSDYRHVNYSNLWVRPPVDVYNQVSVSNFDGADVIWQKALGSTTLTTQVFGGTSHSWFDGARLTAHNELGVNFTLELDDGITLRAGTAHAKLPLPSGDLATLVAALDQSPFASVGEQFSGRRASFSGFGVSVDRGNWVGNAEYTIRKTQDYLPDTSAWEITGGYRIGKVTPFLGFSRQKVDNPNVDNTIPTSTAQLAALHGIVDGVLFATNNAERTTSLGVRWDVYKNIALKAQLDHIQVGSGSGIFRNATPALSNTGVNVYAVSCDFLF